jgi:hypothetical protein
MEVREGFHGNTEPGRDSITCRQTVPHPPSLYRLATGAHPNLGLGLLRGRGWRGLVDRTNEGGGRSAEEDEKGGRREERWRHGGASPVSAAAAELYQERDEGKDEAVGFISKRFRSLWVRKRARLCPEFGTVQGNSGRIPASISRPLQTPEFGSEFCNS